MNDTVATTEAISLVGSELRACASATAIALLRLALVERFDIDVVRFLPSLGIEASESADGLINAVHLHSRGHEGFEQFPFQFNGITFSSRRSEVIQTLGKPLASGLGDQGPWDKFKIGDRTLHFVFRQRDEAMLMVSIEVANNQENHDSC